MTSITHLGAGVVVLSGVGDRSKRRLGTIVGSQSTTPDSRHHYDSRKYEPRPPPPSDSRPMCQASQGGVEVVTFSCSCRADDSFDKRRRHDQRDETTRWLLLLW